MIKLSIRNKIMGIAVTLIALMVVTAIWTVVLVMQVGTRIEEFAYSYVPAYGDLARANIRSLDQGITLRRIVIDKLQSPEDGSRQTALRDRYDSLGGQVELEMTGRTRPDPGADREGVGVRRDIDAQSIREPDRCHQRRPRRRLEAETRRLMAALDSGDEKALDEEMERVDELRDDLNRKLDGIGRTCWRCCAGIPA